jgi:hypothetical protein
VEKNFLQGIKKALDHYLNSYHEKENELEGHRHSGNHTHTADSKPSLPIASIELGGSDGNELSVSEELEVRRHMIAGMSFNYLLMLLYLQLIDSRVMNLSIMQDVLDRVQALLDS